MINRDIGKMSVWEFACAVEGDAAANSSGEEKAPEMDDAKLAALGIEGF